MPDDYVIDSDENYAYIYNTIKTIIDVAGPRAPCSEAERIGHNWSMKEMEKYCDEVEMEPFYCHPKNFLGWIRVSLILAAFSYLFTILTLYGDNLTKLIFSIQALACGFLILLIIYKCFMCYEEFLSPIFKRKKSQNVIGTIKPSGEVKNRIILSGHMDSAFRFNVTHYAYHCYVYVLMGAVFSILFLIISYVLQFVYSILGDLIILTLILNNAIFSLPGFVAFFLLVLLRKEVVFFGVFRYITKRATIIIVIGTIYAYIINLYLLISQPILMSSLVGSITMLILSHLHLYIAAIFFISNKAVPGACDNLTSCALAMCVGKILGDWKKTNNKDFPKNTEVKIALFGCEECGCRGSQAFAEFHAEEYNKINTTCVNMEAPMNPKVVRFYTRENTTRCDLDVETAENLGKVAKELGIEYKISQMPGIAGGSDAAGLARGGLRATCMEGYDYLDYLFWYHTDRDDINLLEPPSNPRRSAEDLGDNYLNRNRRLALERALKILIGYLKFVDSKK